jgi:hypothetical protein
VIPSFFVSREYALRTMTSPDDVSVMSLRQEDSFGVEKPEPPRSGDAEEKKDDEDDDDDDKAVLEEKEEEDAIVQMSVESDVIEPPVFWKTLLQAMNPVVCLQPATACTNVLLDDETVEYAQIVPPMLKDMKHTGKLRTAALQKLYRFTDRKSYKNRVPVVASTRFHTLEALVPCLATDVPAQDRRQALLIINNLCIPVENKRTIMLGPNRDEILGAMLEILRQRLPESHLVAASLFNLSFYKETKGALMHYVPSVDLKHSMTDTPEEYTFSQPTQKQDSLLRIVESVVTDFLPFYLEHQKVSTPKQKSAPSSVEAATLQWCMCLLRNLATKADHASLLATTTQLPAAALQVLQACQATDLVLWSHDSLPEACLVLWVWLVQSSPEARSYLQEHFGMQAELSAPQILQPLANQDGIQAIRAKMILVRLASAVDDETLTGTLASF